MEEIKSKARQIISDIRRKCKEREKSIKDNQPINPDPEYEIGKEIIEESCLSIFPEDESVCIASPEMRKYCGNKRFLSELLEVNPAFVVYASQDIIGDKDFMESLAQKSPMSVVHLFKENKISKEEFYSLCRINPVTVENYWAISYSTIEPEMLEQTLFYVSNKTTYTELRENFSMAWGLDLINESGYDTNKLMDFMAKYSLGDLEQFIYDNTQDEKEAAAIILRLLKKYPQAIKAIDAENFDALADRDEIRRCIAITDDPQRKAEYEKDLQKFEKFGEHIYWEEIRLAMEENPKIERIYLMSDKNFCEYMDEYVLHQGRENVQATEKDAIKARIIEKQQRLRDLTRQQTKDI